MSERTASAIFLQNYEIKVTRHICKMLMFMFLVLPALLFVSVIGLFQITLGFFAVAIPVGFILMFLPTLLLKLKVPNKIIKYIAVMSVGFFLGAISTNDAVNIGSAYVLMPLFAAIYFDKKFTFKMSVLGFFIMAAAVYIRAPGMVVLEIRDRTAIEWFIARITGYTMEYVAVTAMIIAVAGRAKGILDNLSDAEKIGMASKELSSVLQLLRKAIIDSGENNKNVASSADLTFQKCSGNMTQMTQTVSSAKSLGDTIDSVKSETDELAVISADAYKKTTQCGEIMNSAVSSMHEIKEVSDQTSKAVSVLSDKATEISGLLDTIQSIAMQTKILSINASTEAARAGEKGKGFAVVAQNVGELANKSQEAADQITERVDEIKVQVRTVGDAVLANSGSITKGMEQIEDTRKETEEMGALQKDVKLLTESVAVSCERSKESSGQVTQMSETMRALTEESLSAIANIKEYAELQTQALLSIESVFTRVEKLAASLVQ